MLFEAIAGGALVQTPSIPPAPGLMASAGGRGGACADAGTVTAGARPSSRIALHARVALLAANPGEVERDATALADGDDHVGISTARAHPVRERLVVGKPGVMPANGSVSISLAKHGACARGSETNQKYRPQEREDARRSVLYVLEFS